MAQIVAQQINIQTLGMATVRFTPGEVPGQVGSHGRGPVADFFVATGSLSSLILATGGNSQVPAASTKHITIILAEPHTQGGQVGIRVRVNFVADAPPRDQWFEITLAQAGAVEFMPPVRTTGIT
jgi:hypothetical protein